MQLLYGVGFPLAFYLMQRFFKSTDKLKVKLSL